jgi:hypothetical protein
VLLLCAGIGFGVATPAVAQSAKARPEVTTETVRAGFRAKRESVAPLPPIMLDVSRFAFTAPGRGSGARVQTVERGFSFTPSRGIARGVSLGVTARSLRPEPARMAVVDAGVAPSGHDLDLAVGFRGFALNGGVSRVDGGLGGARRDGVDLGLSYAARNWKTGVLASAERGSPIPRPRAELDPRYALEASGALALSPRVSLGASARYRLAPVNPTPLDPNKDDRAVMVGGAVAF